MSFKRIPTDSTERIIVVALDGRRRRVTGLTDLLLSIWRKSGGTSEWLDFNDYTFKTSGWTTRQLALTERDATLSPGIYYTDFATSSIVSPVADDTYYVEVDQYPGASLESQSDGATSIPATRQFTSALATFISNNVLPGDMLTIDDVSSPGDNDDYIIVSVDSETQVTVNKNWPTGSLTGLDYTVYTKTAKNSPWYGELGVGQSEDDIDDILSDTNDIQGKLPTNNMMGSSDKDDHDTQIEDIQSRIPATLSGGRMRSHVEAMDSSVIGAGQIATDAIGSDELAASAVTEIQAGLATSAAVSAVQTDVTDILADTNEVQGKLPTNNIMGSSDKLDHDGEIGDILTDTATIQPLVDVAVSTRAVPGDAMDLVTDAVDATAIATDAIDADALAADAVAEIQSGVATSAALTAVQADTDDIQSRLPATLVGGRMDSDVGNIQNDIITAATIAANAIGASQLAADAVAEIVAALNNLSVSDVENAVWDANVVTGHGAVSAAGLLLRVLGGAISTRSNNATLNSLLGVTDAVGVDLPEQVNTELETVQAHGAGSWQSATPLTSQQVRDAMKLAPTGGAPAAESVDEHLDDILGDTSAIQSLVSLNLDATVSSRATPAQVQTALTAQGYTSARALLLDNLSNLDILISNVLSKAQETLDRLNELNVAKETTASSGSSTTEIRTSLTEADGFYNNMLVVVINSAGVAARNIDNHTQLNGALTVVALPFTPVSGDKVIILARTGCVYVASAAIAAAVWNASRSSHSIGGSFGESVRLDSAGLQANAVTATAIAANAIGATQIDTNAITAAKIAADAIGSLQIANNAITAAKIASAAITATQLGTDAITAAKIATDAIGSDEFAVTAANKIRDTILSDSTAFQGARIDQSLSTTESNIRGSDGDDLKDISDEIASVPVNVFDRVLPGTHPVNSAGERIASIDDRIDQPISVTENNIRGVDDIDLTDLAGSGYVKASHSLVQASSARSNLQDSVDDLSNTARFSATIPILLIPGAGSTDYVIRVNLEDTDGNPEDPDSEAIGVTVVNQSGVDRSGNLSASSMTKLSVGRYSIGYTVSSTHEEEQLIFSFSYSELGVAFIKDKSTMVTSSLAASGFTPADRAMLTDIDNKTDTVDGKLPDSNIMGSGVKTDKDDELDLILSRIGSPTVDLATDIASILSRLNLLHVLIESTVGVSSTTTEVTTAIVAADDYYNDAQVLISGGGEVAVRNINKFLSTNGTLLVNALPFNPVSGDTVIVLGRRGTMASSRPYTV